MAPTMQPTKWTATNLLRDVLATMLEGEKPCCKYEGNGVQVLLTNDALVTYELDDRDTRNPVWVPVERGPFVADDDDLHRRGVWFGRTEWEYKQWALSEGDENREYSYYDGRRNRIEDAIVLLLAKARGGIRPMSATPTVAMSEACGF